MITIDTSKVEPRVIDLLNHLKQDGNSVITEQNGKAIATLIDYQEWERLKQLETQIMEKEKEKEYYTVAEKIGVLSQPNTESNYPHISYKKGVSGKSIPVINNSGLRIQTIIIAHYNWHLSITEIAQEYDLTEEVVKEALAFYQSYQEEINKAIAEEEGLELANV